jgi:dUTP pyrophosphatase
MNHISDPYVRATYAKIKSTCPNTSSNFAMLKFVIDGDDDLKALYNARASEHNKHMFNDIFVDSGFDLSVPEEVVFDTVFKSIFIDMKVRVEMLHCNVATDVITSSPFYMYPRSSISKTPLMLANHTGIIDSGYRGSLIGAFRLLGEPEMEEYVVAKNTKLVQICHPSLCPIFIIFVDESKLTSTERGKGGFGSTGV